MSLTVDRVASGLDNGKGRMTKLFIKGSGFEKHFNVEIREKGGAGIWIGKIQKVYDDGNALVHVNTIVESTLTEDRKIVEIDDENVEIVVTDDDGNSAVGEGSVPIFP
jgi:hypothetical protein